MNNRILNIFLYSFYFLIFTLFCLALINYPGKSYVYILFTLLLNALFFFGFRKNRLFFDTFIGIFFWLGYWLKFSFRTAFMGGKFAFSIGKNFNYSGVAYDHGLLVISCGIAALLIASFIRGKIYFYPEEKSGVSLEGIFTFYKKHRTPIWIAFITLFVSVSVTNAYFGIYQRGTVPQTHLPYKLGGIYTWLLLFGGASLSSLILEFELTINKKPTYSVATLIFWESFFSNVSMLSRGMILNVGGMVVGAIRSLKLHSITLSSRFLIISSLMFIFLFASSFVIVNQLRSYKYSGKHTGMAGIAMPGVSGNITTMILDRWVGLEGAMAVSSYPKLGWDLWKKAWKEKYSNHGTSFYDLEVASSYYTEMDFTKHHFISLPGIIAFFYYPGSFVFLFLSMFLLGALAAGIEISIYKLSESSVILTSLLSQVVACRYAHFGYVPGQSYLLFGTICANVLLIYLLNKFLLSRSNKRIAI
jgi:hypothetical protein